MQTRIPRETFFPDIPAMTSLLVKPVGAACNLRCSYCFYHPEDRGASLSVMGPEILEMLITELLRLPVAELSICWQGGEPLLAGLDFYKRAVRLQYGLNQNRTLTNSIQTNGLLINRQWATFLSKNDFLVGLSLDGPKDLHDSYRIDSRKQGSWDLVMDAAKHLQDALVPVNALCCVSAQTVSRVEEVFSFFLEQGFSHVQFIPLLEAKSSDKSELASFSLSSDAYAVFLCRLWDLWVEALRKGKGMGIRFFESFCHVAFGLAPTLCEMHPVCGGYVVVEHDGALYPCDFFVNEYWKLGTLDQGLPEVVFSPKARHFNEIRLMLQPECRQCPCRKWCHGGCLKYRKVGSRLYPKTYFCAAYRHFFAHAQVDLPLVSRLVMGSDCPSQNSQIISENDLSGVEQE